MPFVYVVGAILLFAPIKLITDNVLYAAIVRRLKTDFGIEEDGVVTFVTSNLVPILITLAIIALIYRLATYQHRTPLAAEHSKLIDRAFGSLGAAELNWLHTSYASGRPPYSIGESLFGAELVDRDTTGFTEVKE